MPRFSSWGAKHSRNFITFEEVLLQSSINLSVMKGNWLGWGQVSAGTSEADAAKR